MNVWFSMCGSPDQHATIHLKGKCPGSHKMRNSGDEDFKVPREILMLALSQ